MQQQQTALPAEDLIHQHLRLWESLNVLTLLFSSPASTSS